MEESISISGNTVTRLTKEELEALTKDIQEVLKKHNAEMGVTSTISLMKVTKTPHESTNSGETTDDSDNGN